MNQKETIIRKLKALGFDPADFGAMGCVFRYEGLNYLYLPDDRDEHFLRIIVPNLFTITDDNRVEVLEAMHETGQMLKYSKVCIMYEDSVCAVYEHLYGDTEDLTDILEHMILVLALTANVFHEKINGNEHSVSSEEPDAAYDAELEAEIQRMLENSEDE